MAALVNGIQAELAASGYKVIDRSAVARLFRPLIDASRSALEAETERYRGLLAARYGIPPERAFLDVAPLDTSFVLAGVNAQTAATLKQQMELERLARLAAQNKGLVSKERAELNRYRDAAKRKKRKARERRKAATKTPSKTQKRRRH